MAGAFSGRTSHQGNPHRMAGPVQVEFGLVTVVVLGFGAGADAGMIGWM